ncbi:hypothetical protein DL95DRAFT_403639 [Leptodontidium sp. 2 PMI_412]|nr:hypothetical protein DL95DRAFT_403639 [Leptodontidium sp. 2 PMI_412]
MCRQPLLYCYLETNPHQESVQATSLHKPFFWNSFASSHGCRTPTSLSLDGKSPMVITTTHQCVSSEPIIALMKLDAQRGMGIGIHDPRRKNRRMGPMPDVTQCYDDYSEFEEFDDCSLVRLKPGETCATTLTLRIVPRTTADGLQTSFPVAKEDACQLWFGGAVDKGYLVKGNIYEVKAMRRSWRWMLESEMEKLGGELSDERCWEILKKKKTTE